MADNDAGLITPAVARQVLLDIINSYPNLLGQTPCGINLPGCFNVETFSPGLPPNPASWGISFVRFGTTLSLPGNAVPGSANQFGFITQVHVPSIVSPAGYEKGAAFFECVMDDVSTAVIFRACVGSESRALIMPTNTLGEAYGGLDNARIVAGGVGDGLLVGREIDILNEGTDQPSINTTTSKYGLQIVNQGSVASTAAILLGATPGLWHRGFVAPQSSFVTIGADPNAAFIQLLGASSALYAIRPDGIVIQDIPANGAINFFQTTNNGISAHVFGSNPAVGNNTDEVDLGVNFRTNTGTAYTGGSLDFNQLDATNAAPVTQFALTLVTGARVNTHVLVASINNAGTLGEWAPVTDNVMSLGDAARRWSAVYAGVATPPVSPLAGSGAYCMSSNSKLCIYMGAGTPSFSAAKSSLFMNTAPTGTTSRLFVNTTGEGGTWANFTASF